MLRRFPADGEGGVSGGTAVAGEAVRSVSGYRRDDPRRCVDSADAVVAGIYDEQVACRVEGDAVGHGEACLVGRAAVAGELRRAGAGYGRDRPAWGDPSYAVVRAVGDVEAAVGVQRYIAGEGYRGLCGGTAITTETLLAGTGDGGDDARRGVDHADTRVAMVGYVEVTVGADGNGDG